MFVRPVLFADIMRQAPNKAEGAHRVLKTIREGIRKHSDTVGKEGFAPEAVSIKNLGIVLDVIDPYDLQGSYEALEARCGTLDPNKVHEESIFHEANPGLMTNAFQVITGELLGASVMAGYKDDTGFIGDELCTVVQTTRRNTKVPGVSALGGPLEVHEGHPYPETVFDEKYVSTKETKKGRIVSLTQESVLFDQTGMLALACRDLGYWVRQERERTIVRGVQDADSGSGVYVYRPSGVETALYNTDGSLKNYIGVGNTTDSSFNTAVPLVDWTDIDTVRLYRATAVKDDRIDGTPLPIAGLNSPRNILLVPEGKRSTADYIHGATSQVKVTDTAANETNFGNPTRNVFGKVLSSPFVDEVDAANYYLGDFKKQFIWSEVWPVQTFIQGNNSEAAFERDTGLRVKVRYFGALVARDTKYVTCVDGL